MYGFLDNAAVDSCAPEFDAASSEPGKDFCVVDLG